MSQTAPLLLWLHQHAPAYFYKAGELRAAVGRWLTYVPATFHHYTSHTVDHSDEIILQLSKILFHEDDSQRMVVHLSSTEAYILVASAYLHDAGMVTSEAEKLRILESREWKEWIASGPNSVRLTDIEAFRCGPTPGDAQVRNYLADLQVRFLVAEFVRRNHHLRSGAVVEQNQSQLGRFAFDDDHLLAAIASVCVAHGLWHQELIDEARFPEERDIHGEKVNLRFLAILLRLGDLLDLRTERACPILLNAACPLPPESYPHWMQYKRITHRVTTPDRIEISAKCVTVAEHRVLRDWCKWIVDEIEYATRTMVRARRHGSWIPPKASMGEPGATIQIAPHETATYVDVDWTFEIDAEAVFERLIRDVHNSAFGFVRELLQNALDATRCRMFDEAGAAGISLPQSPSMLPAETRQNYPVILRLRTVEVLDQLSGQSEKRHVIEVEDRGTGMNLSIIRNYLLQVGRSWYRTREFSNRYSFVPSSRFGIGFLSVFGASTRVQVSSWMGDSEQAIRLELTGPRSYLLVERADKSVRGTIVAVTMTGEFTFDELVRFLKESCPRVEVPIIVEDGSRTYTHLAESPRDFVQTTENQYTGDTYEIRSYPVSRAGIEGELYVFVRTGAGGPERWDTFRSWRDAWRRENPGVIVPEPPEGVICTNGMVVANTHGLRGTDAVRLDYRSEAVVPDLARRHIRLRTTLGRAVEERWEELLQGHLASVTVEGDRSWQYRQRLASSYEVDRFWFNYPEMVPSFRRGSLQLSSMAEIAGWPVLTLVTQMARYGGKNTSELMLEASRDLDGPIVVSPHLDSLCTSHARGLFSGRRMAAISALGTTLMRIDWEWSSEDRPITFRQTREPILMRGVQVVPLAGEVVAVRVAVEEHGFFVALNGQHPFVQWLVGVRASGWIQAERVDVNAFDVLVEHLCSACDNSNGQHLKEYVDRWRDLPNLPEPLQPPALELSKASFRLMPDAHAGGV